MRRAVLIIAVFLLGISNANADEIELFDSTASSTEYANSVVGGYHQWNEGGTSCDLVPDWTVSKMIVSVKRAPLPSFPYNFGAQIVVNSGLNSFGGVNHITANETYSTTSTAFSEYTFTWDTPPNLRALCETAGESAFVAIGYMRSSGAGLARTKQAPNRYEGVFHDGGGEVGSDFAIKLYGPEVGSPTCAANCFSNVLFLPGIESSRLYRPDYAGGTERLWEPGNSDDVRNLYMNDTGESIRDDIYAKERDVLDEISVTGANIYKSFIVMMDEMKDEGTITDWNAASYDWRLPLDEILTKGNKIDDRMYYAGPLAATSTPYIIQELRRLAASSKSGKVTIVAHSNGGLVAKRLTQILGEEAPTLIDKMIFVAVPQEGTPMAIAAGLHGYDQALARGLIASEAEARAFASTAPMFYQLLPSAGYFSQVSDPVISFIQNATKHLRILVQLRALGDSALHVSHLSRAGI